jgi:hypothetical protein
MIPIGIQNPDDVPALFREYSQHLSTYLLKTDPDMPQITLETAQRLVCESQIMHACTDGPHLPPVVYIASPYTKGDQEENVRRQIDVAERLAEKGYAPFWPLHSHYWHQVYPHPPWYWLALDLVFLLKCDALLRLDGDSAGGDLEVFCAEQNDIPVFYDINDLVEAFEDRYGH